MHVHSRYIASSARAARGENLHIGRCGRRFFAWPDTPPHRFFARTDEKLLVRRLVNKVFHNAFPGPQTPFGPGNYKRKPSPPRSKARTAGNNKTAQRNSARHQVPPPRSAARAADPMGVSTPWSRPDFVFVGISGNGQVTPSRRSAPSLDAPQVGYLAAVGFSRSAQAASVSEAQHLELEIGGASTRGRSDPVAAPERARRRWIPAL